MYKDYAVNEQLFHWQSQSATSASTETGRRYIEHERRGSRVLLFCPRVATRSTASRNPTSSSGLPGTAPHEGSRPMSIIWELDYPMPAGFFLKANKMVVG